jgi:hypothetical protein
MTPRTLGFVILATVAIGLAPPMIAIAQTYDHLKCYKMKDPHNFTAVANLAPIQNPPFPVEPGCKIKVRGVEFCIPVDKTLVPGTGNAPSAPVAGQPLQNDFICYNMKCPKPPAPIPPVLVSDQFGSRTLQKFTARRICTPAIKGLPTTTTIPQTTTTTTTTTMPSNPCMLDQQGACLGTCPNAGDTCLYDPATGVCDCYPQSAQCTLDLVGMCVGLCPHANDICAPDPSGTPPCTCQQPPPCNLATFPACNGTCPGGKVCVKDATTSFCHCCGVLAAPCVTTPDCCTGFTCIAGTCQ